MDTSRMNLHTVRHLLVLSALLPAAELRAQWFSRLLPEQVPLHPAQSVSVDAGDIDGDGDVDLVFLRGNTTAQPLVYRNQGMGRFTQDATGMAPLPTGEYGAVRLADLDGDGDLDLVATRWSGQLVIFRNQGGTFTDVTATASPNVTIVSLATSILVFDADRDGDLDLLLAVAGRTYLFLNNGVGVFTDGSSRVPVTNQSIAAPIAADIDGDGDLDLLIARTFGTATERHLLLLNNGSGFFTDVSAQRLPVFGNVDGPGGVSVAAGDLDGDGDQDFVVGQGRSRIAFYRNTAGFFTEAASWSIADIDLSPYYVFPNRMRLGDVDRDGDLDLVFDGGEYGRHLFLNDGTGALGPAPVGKLPQARQIVRETLLVDIDGDEDLDLVQATPGLTITARPLESNSVAFNDGRGNFLDVGRNPLPTTVDETLAVLAIDLDRDGFDDLLHGIGIGGSSQPIGMLFAYRSNGDGTFVFQERVAFDQNLGGVAVLAAADVDGDGWRDVYAGTWGGANLLFQNQKGRLVLQNRIPAVTSRASAAVFGDFDRDGDQDLITARVTGSPFGATPQQTMFWRNDGTGVFTDATAESLPTSIDRANFLVAFDLQRDGDLDLFIGNANSGNPPNRLLVNGGNADFTDQSAQRLPAGQYGEVYGAVAADFDGNGFDDLFFSHQGGINRSALLLDSGTGVFTDAMNSWRDLFFLDFVRIAAWDVDHDGRVDLVNTAPTPKVLRNLPTNRFQVVANTAPPVEPVQWSPRFPAVGDFDGDGEPDILHGGAWLSIVHWNLRHRISVPYLPKPGTTVPMRIHANPGHNAVARPAFFAASLSRLRSSHPFGTLWLDPAEPISIQAALLPAPGGVAEVPLAVGPAPVLQGLQFTVQGFLLTPDLSWAEFTNPLTLTIR